MQTLHLLVSGEPDEIKNAIDLLGGRATTAPLSEAEVQIDIVRDNENLDIIGPVEVTLALRRQFPFDERIHSPAQKKNNDGTWLNQRGGDKDLRVTVEQELARAIISGGAATQGLNDSGVSPEDDNGQCSAAPTPTPNAAPTPAPVKTLEATGEFTIEQLREAKWEDQQMVDAGHAKWVESTPTPSTPTAPLAPAGGVTPDDVMRYITDRVAGTAQPPMTEAQATEVCSRFGMTAPFDIYKDAHCTKAAEVMAAAQAVV